MKATLELRKHWGRSLRVCNRFRIHKRLKPLSAESTRAQGQRPLRRISSEGGPSRFVGQPAHTKSSDSKYIPMHSAHPLCMGPEFITFQIRDITGNFPFVINTPEAGFCDHAATPGARLWWAENLLFHIQLEVSNSSLPPFHSLPVQWYWLNSEWWAEVTLCFEKELPWIWWNKPRVKIWSMRWRAHLWNPIIYPA